MERPGWSQRLRDARRAMHLSQETLARLVGYSVQQVYRWERGDRYPRQNARTRLARVLGVSVTIFDQDTDNGDDGEVAA